MPTYREKPEAVSKLTPEQYRSRKLTGPSAICQRLLGQHGGWSLRRRGFGGLRFLIDAKADCKLSHDFTLQERRFLRSLLHYPETRVTE